MFDRRWKISTKVSMVGKKGEPRRVLFFFFQAEDGIRDWSVTGVQTCALPISRGPVDRKATTGFWCVGVWNFSKNQELAKDFLRYHFQPDNQNKWVEAGHGFNMPFLTNLTKHPVYKSDKQYRFIPEVARVSVPPSWPGPTTAASQQVWDLYIIPDMFAQHATGKMTADQAITWAEKEMQEIYAGRKRRP